MSTWYYYDENGQRLGPITGGQLKWLAKNGKITPGTVVETENGKTAVARKVKGLTFIGAEQPETPTSELTQPVEEEAVQQEIPPSELTAVIEPGIYGLASPEQNPSTDSVHIESVPLVAETSVAEPVSQNPFTVAAPASNNPFVATAPVSNSPFVNDQPVSDSPFTVIPPALRSPFTAENMENMKQTFSAATKTLWEKADIAKPIIIEKTNVLLKKAQEQPKIAAGIVGACLLVLVVGGLMMQTTSTSTSHTSEWRNNPRFTTDVTKNDLTETVKIEYQEFYKHTMKSEDEGGEYIRTKSANRLTDWEKSAKEGIPEGQALLGFYYHFVLPDGKKACVWLNEAARQGNALAQTQMGGFCVLISALEEDENMLFEGVNWWHRAAEQGCPKAQYLLGCFYSGGLYRNGKGHKKDIINMADAEQWYRKAADQGYADAKEELRKIKTSTQSGENGI